MQVNNSSFAYFYWTWQENTSISWGTWTNGNHQEPCTCECKWPVQQNLSFYFLHYQFEKHNVTTFFPWMNAFKHQFSHMSKKHFSDFLKRKHGEWANVRNVLYHLTSYVQTLWENLGCKKKTFLSQSKWVATVQRAKKNA